jgi:NAD-dependent DNA ligase
MYSVRGLLNEYVILKKEINCFHVIKVNETVSEKQFDSLEDVYHYCDGLFLVTMYFSELEAYPGGVCLLDDLIKALKWHYEGRSVHDDHLVYEKIKAYLREEGIGLDELFLISLKGAKIVFTGRLSRYTRAIASRKAQACGAYVQSYVNKETTYLIKGTNHHISNKYRCAERLNIPIIEEEQFYRMVSDI